MRRLSLRTRLTLVYAGLFVVMAAVLLGVDYTLLDQNLPRAPSAKAVVASGLGVNSPGQSTSAGTVVQAPSAQLSIIANDLRDQTLKQLILQSGIALALAAILATVFGWLLAGRVVGPVKAVTAQARRMSERNLHERIALRGPEDELKDLADTFDAMLARLDSAFEGQRMFVANASHELRTPLAISRTAVDVQLHRQRPTQEQWRAMAEIVLESTARSERLIDSLLLLARIEQGNHHKVNVDLGVVLEDAAADARAIAGPRSPEIAVASQPAVVSGDPELLRRLVGNLLENSVRHNHDGGLVRASVEAVDREAVLTVTNGGELLSDQAVRQMLQPFHRGAATRSAGNGGVGLGLSIVGSVARAHGGSLALRPLPEGGLQATITLPLTDERPT